MSNTSVPDTTSGFRAYTREAALRMTIVSEFSYTLESIIQAGKKRMAIAHVPIETNPRTRQSRLFDSMFSYIKRSAATIVRIYAMYEPLKIFTYVGVTIIMRSARCISSRFVYTFLTERVTWAGHLQSLILAGVVVIIGVQVLLIGLLADVISANRKLLEDLALSRALARAAAPADDAAAGDEPARELSRTRRRAALGPLTAWPIPQTSPSSSRPTTKARSIAAGRRRRSPRRARGTRSSSSTTGRRTTPARTPRAAGATVVRHPYNKGNGAAVKSGIRRATGEYVLIVDGDGQHSPEDARRLVARLGEYDLVIGARSTSTQATHARRFGNTALNRLASYLTGREIPDLTSGFRARAPRVPARVPAPAAERVLDADDDDAGVHQGGLQRRLRADRGAPARRAVEDPASRATARSSSSSSSRS